MSQDSPKNSDESRQLQHSTSMGRLSNPDAYKANTRLMSFYNKFIKPEHNPYATHNTSTIETFDGSELIANLYVKRLNDSWKKSGSNHWEELVSLVNTMSLQMNSNICKQKGSFKVTRRDDAELQVIWQPVQSQLNERSESQIKQKEPILLPESHGKSSPKITWKNHKACTIAFVAVVSGLATVLCVSLFAPQFTFLVAGSASAFLLGLTVALGLAAVLTVMCLGLIDTIRVDLPIILSLSNLIVIIFLARAL